MNYPKYTEYYTWFKLRHSIVNSFLEFAKPGFKILEVGCNFGANLSTLHDLDINRNSSMFGFDISKKLILQGTSENENKDFTNISLFVGDANMMPLKESRFDMILCAEVIEHLKQPNKAITEIYRILKPGGYAIITTPNKDNIPQKISDKLSLTSFFIKNWRDPKSEKINADDNIDGSYGHISELKLKELKKICQSTGFQIITIRRNGIIYGFEFFDHHQFVFALLLILDSVLDYLPFTENWTWGNTLIIKK